MTHPITATKVSVCGEGVMIHNMQSLSITYYLIACSLSIFLHLVFFFSLSRPLCASWCPLSSTVLITHLAAAESRCVKLERQLDHMKRMLRHAKADSTNLLKQHVSTPTAGVEARIEMECL